MKINICAALIVSLHFFAAQAQEQDNFIETGRLTVQTTSAEILGEFVADSYADVIDENEEIKWSIYVPKNYDPSSPPGIIVHMTEEKRGKIPIGWSNVFEDKNMIWISLINAGHVMPNKEMILAVLSTPYLQSKYTIDLNRIYLTASTISCLPASAAMQIYPDIFKGVIYSTCEPIDWKNEIPESIEPMKQNRYVFVASNEKPVRDAMRRIYNKYSGAGINNLEFLDFRRLIYGRNLDRRGFAKSIDTLDSFN